MRKSWRERAVSLLFASEEVALENFKLCRGDNPDLTDEDISEQVHVALTQKKLGRARSSSKFTRDCSQAPVNVATAFAN